MGLESVAPWNWIEKVKLAVAPETMVWVVGPVLARVKSGLGLMPMPRSCGVEVLEMKLGSPE